MAMNKEMFLENEDFPSETSNLYSKPQKVDYSKKAAPFSWIWDVEVNPNGDIDVFLTEKGKKYLENYEDEIKVISMKKDAVQRCIDANTPKTKFEQVNLEGKLANEADEIIDELRRELIDRYEKAKRKIPGLISDGGLTLAYRQRVLLIAGYKALSAAYKKAIDPTSVYIFHLN